MPLGDTRLLADRASVKEYSLQIEKTAACRCLTFEPLSKHTSWRVGGPAALYVYPNDADSVGVLLRFLREEGIPSFVIGYGTNLLPADEGFGGCVIDLGNACRKLEMTDDEMIAGAGIWLHDAVKAASESGLQGMEKLAGIPGGVGGGLSMNCGAFGSAISDHLRVVTVLDEVGERAVLPKPEVNFQYRSAPGLVNKILLEARFKMSKEPPAEVVAEMEATIRERFRRNVMTLPSAGSVFKNPTGFFAAKLVESVGSKGMAEGGVEISRLHANFIVNARGGTAGDILRLIRRVRALVRERHGLNLELEVRTLGFEDDPNA